MKPFYSSNQVQLLFRSFALVILMSFSLDGFAQTNPAPQPLPYSQDFGTLSFSVMPPGTAAWNGVSGGSTTTQTAAENSTPTGDATVAARTTVTSTGGSFGYATITPADARYYIQTSSNTTNGVNQLAIAVNTLGSVNVTVGYSVEMLVTQVRTIGVVMQFRVGTSGPWTTVTGVGNPFSQSGGTTGIQATPSIQLPPAADNQPEVQIRWAIWRGTESGNSPGLAIDNITVTGASASPVITTSVSSLPDFGLISTGSSSAEESFVVQGDYMTDPLDVTVAAPFEISLTSGSGFTNSITLTPLGQTVSPTNIYVRFSPTAGGFVQDSVFNASVGAVTKKVALSGTGSSCPVPSISPSGTVTTCTGIPVTLTASSGLDYLWSTGETTQSIDVSTPGSYTVTVTDVSTCTATSNAVTVVVNSFGFTGTLFSENVGTPSATTFVNDYTGWQNQGVLSFQSNSANAADVRTTAASSGYTGASGGGNVFLGTAGTLDREFTISNINTSGYSGLALQFGLLRSDLTGSLVVEVSDDGLTWTPLTITQPSPANSWKLTTASGAIPATSNLRIRFSKPAITTQFRIDDISLSGTTNSVAISVNGSTTICDGTYITLVSNIPTGNQWSPDPFFTNSIPVFTANTYTVTVTDQNGCTATSAPVTTTVIPSPSATATATDPMCYGGNDGTATVVASGGTAPYTYAWNTFPVQTLDMASGLTAGTYDVTVTDVNGCTGTTSALVNETPQLTIDLTTTNASCFGANDGEITANTTSGVGPYTYHWDTVNTSASTTNFAVVVVPKDASHPYFGLGNGNGFEVNGVQGKELTLVRGITYTFDVNTPGHPFHITTDSLGGSFAGEVTNGVTNSGVMTGTLTFTPNASHPDTLYYACGFHQLMGYHINIVDGVNGATLSGLAPGTYTVTTTDANGCTGSASSTVTEPFEIAVSSFAPTSGVAGDPVTITGSGYLSVTDVLFNGVSATSFTVDNFFQITAEVPAGATTGPITVVAGACSGTSSTDFTINSSNVVLELTTYLQGYYVGGPEPLNPALYNSGLSANPSDADSIQVALFDPGNTSVPVLSYTVNIPTDGRSQITIFGNSLIGNSYYIRVRHRNALETWSANPVLFSANTSYDFTTAASQAYGSNQVEVSPGVWAFWSGDVYDLNSGMAGAQDGFIESSDYSQLENDSQAFLFGYETSDITGDGIVESADYGMIENNSQLFIFAQQP